MTRYFKLQTANKADLDQVMWLLQNKIFYPEATSTPALPGTYDSTFDYRQLFIFISQHDGYPVVKTREYTNSAGFGTSYVPTAEWTSRYKLSAAPTIVEMSDLFTYNNGRTTHTTAEVFLRYHYED